MGRAGGHRHRPRHRRSAPRPQRVDLVEDRHRACPPRHLAKTPTKHPRWEFWVMAEMAHCCSCTWCCCLVLYETGAHQCRLLALPSFCFRRQSLCLLLQSLYSLACRGGGVAPDFFVSEPKETGGFAKDRGRALGRRRRPKASGVGFPGTFFTPAFVRCHHACWTRRFEHSASTVSCYGLLFHSVAKT